MYFSLIVKTLFMYFFIICIYKFIGKKEINELNIMDLIISIIISCLISFSLEFENQNIFLTLIPILVLVILQAGISYISSKNEKIRNLIEGKPTILIKNGKLQFTEMSKLRYSLDDLLTKLRLQGVKSIDKVKYAVLETNGNLSVFSDNADYPLPLILYGVIDYNVLKEINKNYDWLLNILKKKNLELDEVFYAFYTEGKIFIIKKSELL